MDTGRRLPLLTEILELPPELPNEPPQERVEPAPATRVVGSLAAIHPAGTATEAPGPAAPQQARLADHPAVSTEMARAVLELELEQALREVLEPRLAVLLRETAAELAQRLQPRMHEWLDEHGEES